MLIHQLIIENAVISISNPDRDNIFKHLYFRTNEAKKANPTGMGIGLSVARAIIRAHHGELNLESQGKDTGAKVSVRLPLK